jgi:hypothetical protein
MNQRAATPQPRIRNAATRRAWTSGEEAYLRDHYRAQTVATLAARLKRTVNAVKVKSHKLGLHKRHFAAQVSSTGEFYRVSAIATGLGVPEGRVWRWIYDGWLHMHAQWIAGEDLATFLRAHPGAVDPRAMTAEQRRWAQAIVGTPVEQTRARPTPEKAGARR